MSKDIIFPDGIHDKNISYVNQYSVHQFFDNPENTKLFFIFLAQKLLNSSKSSDDNKKYIFNPVAVIENNKAATIDVEYNFLIEALAEWISHYSANKTVTHEYKIYHEFEDSDKDGNSTFVNKYRTIKVELSVAEKVMFDYAYDGWLRGNKFHKKCRYDFLYRFMGDIINSKIVWVNMKVSPKFRILIHRYLLCDNAQNETFVDFNSVKLSSSTLEYYIGKTLFKNLKKMGTSYEKMTSQNKHVENKIEELNGIATEVKKYQPFDINLLENTRDLGDGEWHFFKKEK